MLIFYRKEGYETGKILGDRLLNAYPRQVKVSKNPDRVARLLRRFRGATLVRWGVSDNPEFDNIDTINPAQSLKMSTNKLFALRHMKECGVRCPRTWEFPENIESFPVLGRDKYHHGGLDVVKILGSNVRALNDFTKIPVKDFYVEFIPSNTEYRVHVFNNKPVRVTKKTFRGHNRGGEQIDTRDNIRNDIYGWGHSNITLEEWPTDACQEAVKAVNSLGLTFGAVDVIVSSVSKQAYVLEVNSAPRLNTVGQQIYLTELCDMLGLDFYPEVFGFEDEQDDEYNEGELNEEEEDEQ